MVLMAKFMRWINKYAEGVHQIYTGNVLEAFQPLDFFHFYPLWYDVWLECQNVVFDILKVEQKTYGELKELLPVPSNLRALLQKIVPSYRAFSQKNPVVCRRVVEFLVRMLEEACPADPFGLISTPVHTYKEVRELVRTVPWQIGNETAAKLLGKLITAGGSLAHGLYNDLVTDLGWDTYGPYPLGNNRTLLIRYFSDFRPKELWSEQFLGSVKEVVIYQIYENVQWKIAGVGCHTVVLGGNPITGLKQYAVVADGREIFLSDVSFLVTELAKKSEALYKEVRNKSFEELKKLVLRQECYQLKKLFDAAGLDWQPTPLMLARVENKPLLTGLIPHGRMISNVEEFKEVFGVNEFVTEVYGVKQTGFG